MRILLGILILGITTLSGASALAQNSARYCDQLASDLYPIFEKVFAQKYRLLMCSDNAKALADEMVLAGFRNVQVLNIRHPGAPYLPVRPAEARVHFGENAYHTSGWAFHMLVVVEGLVLDFDYTDELRLEGVDSYFARMWPGDLDYIMQIKPAEDYKDRDLFGQFDQELYPRVGWVEGISELRGGVCAGYKAH